MSDFEQFKEDFFARIREKRPFKREKKVQEKYDDHLSEIECYYVSVEDYIRIRYLGYDIAIDPKTGKKEAKASYRSLFYAIEKNEYPYILPMGIEHYVLWLDGDIPLSEIMIPYRKCCVYESDYDKRSVK